MKTRTRKQIFEVFSSVEVSSLVLINSVFLFLSHVVHRGQKCKSFIKSGERVFIVMNTTSTCPVFRGEIQFTVILLSLSSSVL